MNAVLQNGEAAILSRVVSPENANLSKEAAQSILQITFPESDRDRMNTLAAKAREGVLNQDEDLELEEYRRVGRLLEILKAKARLSLRVLGQSAAT